MLKQPARERGERSKDAEEEGKGDKRKGKTKEKGWTQIKKKKGISLCLPQAQLI